MPKVMLVEDDNNLREIYAARMQAEGYEVVTAADGEEALVTGKAEKPDLIISDVMMPKISGFEMLDIIRNTEGMKDVKIIMLTALGQSDEQERADKLGANKYLVKSQVTLEDIVKAAHEMLGDQGDAAAPAGTAEVPAPAPATPAPDAPVTPATETPSEPAAAASEMPSTPQEATPAPAEPTIPAAETPTEAPAIEPTPTSTPESAPVADDSSIESVVAGATENTDSASATPSDQPAMETPVSPNEESKVLTDAVDTLLAKTPESEQGTTTSDAPAETSSGMKVINPIDTEPKKDINELLAAEEAKEEPAAATETPAAAAPEVNSEPPAEPVAAPEATEPAATPEATPAPAEPAPETPNPADQPAPAAEAPADPAKAPDKPFDPNIAL